MYSIEIRSPRGSGTCIVMLAGGSLREALCEQVVELSEIDRVSNEHRRVDDELATAAAARSTASTLQNACRAYSPNAGPTGCALRN